MSDNKIVEFTKKEQESNNIEKNASLLGDQSLIASEDVVTDDSGGQYTLDFFGDIAAKKEEEKKKAEEKKKSVKNNPTSKKVTKKEDPKVERDWTVTFGTEHHKVYEYLPDIQVGEKVDMEKLREAMEKDYFALSKARTRWDYTDSDKKIVHAVAAGATKGSE